MDLRFRLNRTDDEEGASAAQMVEWARQYEAFVAARRKAMPPDLWRYFGADAFHDGLIERIAFDSACGTVELRLTCPNVKYFRAPDAAFEFVNVDFIARFEGVCKFVLERENENSRATYYVRRSATPKSRPQPTRSKKPLNARARTSIR